MSKRISASDRFEALSRIAEYKEEWKRYEQTRASGTKTEEDQAAEIMCRRWGIKAPFPPFFVRSVDILGEPPVEVVKGIYSHAPPLQDNRHIQAVVSAAAKRGNHSSAHWLDRPEIEGDFLYLKIDITAPESILLAEFEKILSRYSSNTRIDGGGRKKESKFVINKWELFDTCRMEETTPSKIAESRTPAIGDAVTYLRQQDNYRKQATAALKEANQIIDSIKNAALLS